MNTTYRLTAEQVANLRNNMIIVEALQGTEPANTAGSPVEANYDMRSLDNMNKRAGDPPSTEYQAKESRIYGDITKGLYNYVQSQNISTKVSTEIERGNPNISPPMSKDFIDRLLYGIYKMANDPTQNQAFERLMRSIGVTLTAEIIAKDNEI